MKLTKQQRRNYYIDAMNMYSFEKKVFIAEKGGRRVSSGVCDALFYAIENKTNSDSPICARFMRLIFPELELFHSSDRLYWLEEEVNKDLRVTVLAFCIAMCE